MIQKQVAVYDIPSLTTTTDIRNASKINENISFKKFFSKRSKRCSLAPSHNIKLSEISYSVYMCDSSYSV